MTTLTIAIPSYNSQDYLLRCLNSLEPVPDDVEVIIVNDGSTDATAEIAQAWVDEHPGARVINKENGGHGSGVNTGLREAKGSYYKVVDSDDWLDHEALDAVLNVLRDQNAIDVLITNYVYEKQGKIHKHVMEYRSALPVGHNFGWDEMGRFRQNQAILMHSLIYRTQMLRNIGLQLPEHTFYVDNLVAFVPLPAAKKLRYLPVDLYRYYIGRNDQSVNEEVMIRRIDEQLRVNRLMIEALPPAGAVHPKLRRYLLRFLGLVTAVSSVLLIRSGTPQHLAEKKKLWQDLRHADVNAYHCLRRSLVGGIVTLPGELGRKTTMGVYHVAKKAIGFN